MAIPHLDLTRPRMGILSPIRNSRTYEQKSERSPKTYPNIPKHTYHRIISWGGKIDVGNLLQPLRAMRTVGAPGCLTAFWGAMGFIDP